MSLYPRICLTTTWHEGESERDDIDYLLPPYELSSWRLSSLPSNDAICPVRLDLVMKMAYRGALSNTRFLHAPIFSKNKHAFLDLAVVLYQ
jgi:hypothetical protein